MGPHYAGVLGTLACLAVLVRGLARGAIDAATMTSAWLALLSFAVVGLIIGQIAQSIVRESVQSALAEELAAETDTAPADTSLAAT